MTKRPRRPVTDYFSDPMAFIEDLTVPTPSAPRFGDVMAPFQRIRLRKLVPDLHALVKKERPPIGRHWWEATKGASKDTDLAAAALWLLAFASRPLYGQVGAADAGQAAELRKAAQEWVNMNPWLNVRIKILKGEIRGSATGSTIEINTADASTSHGARPDFLLINELHAIKSKAIAETWADNADKIPWGVRVIATNAGFQNTWQWKWRELARKGSKIGTWYFHKWSEPAPWISMVQLAESRNRNSASRYMRLWEGVWVAGTGDALEPADVEACVRLEKGLEPGGDWIFLGGLDLGVRHDHSALVILGAKPLERIQLALCESWAPGPDGKVDLLAVRRGVKTAHEKYGLAWLGYDPSQAELMAQELERSHVPANAVEFRGKNLDLMAREILQTFRNRRIDLYPDARLMSDLFRLTIVEKAYGYKLEAISDEMGHADTAIALAIPLPLALEVSMADVDGEDGGGEGAEPAPMRLGA